jgi:hypothetical protein
MPKTDWRPGNVTKEYRDNYDAIFRGVVHLDNMFGDNPKCNKCTIDTAECEQCECAGCNELECSGGCHA